ncbi:hypothetical protein SLS58_004384 [Diplodia intermedia]|uniref:C2H2-type domain-containing protein n=1 Tax=Diplodia intermedia TaxID=856260 RepID=A0ABR3TUA5_9PEZI
MASCNVCRKSFNSEQALRQHSEDSPAHKRLVRCDPCNRSFPNSEALAQHTSNSPAHKNNHTCKPCQRSFPSSEALAQHHIRDTPSHHDDNNNNKEKNKKEKENKKEKKNNKKPRNHNATATTTTTATTTPLDAFFLSHGPSFRYDRTLPASASWRDLCAHNGWQRNKYDGEYVDPDARDARGLYVLALRLELEAWFGGEDDLGSWQALCRAVGVVPPPEAEKECERALRGTHVNLVDLVAWARRDKEVGGGLMGCGNDTVEVFGSVGALAEYCAETGKWFPLDEVAEAGKQGDGKVVIRHLLRKLRVRC